MDDSPFLRRPGTKPGSRDSRSRAAGRQTQAYFVSRTETELAGLERLASFLTVGDSPPTAKMVHTLITHLPTVLRSDCSTGRRRFDRPGAIAQTRCAFRAVVALLERLDAEGIYDATDIVLVADHGYGFGSTAVEGTGDWKLRQMVGALNPTVLVKPAGARGPRSVSDAPIGLTDLAGALCGEVGCAPSEGLRDLANVDAGRIRQVFWYHWRQRYWGLPQIPGITEYSIRGDLTRAESWSRGATPYTPGTLLDFRRGRQNSAPYLGVGWGRRVPTHQPMADAQATSRLRASFDPAREYEVALSARLSGFAPEAPARVAMRVNGVAIGEIVSHGPTSAPRDYRLAIPPSALLQSPETTITFAVEPTAPGEGAPPTRFALLTLELRPRP